MKRRPKRLRAWKWSDPLYGVTIVLLRGSGDHAIAWLNKTFGDVRDEEYGAFQGAKTVWIERPRGVAMVLWFPAWFAVTNDDHLSVLAHESFHAAEFVMRERGCTLTDSSDEAYAYYVSWTFRECLTRLRKAR